MNCLCRFVALAVFLPLTQPAATLAQDKDKDQTQAQDKGQAQTQDKETDHGYVDLGVRFATGDVYGRPDLPFAPALKDSKFNEYRDVRDGFFLRRADVRFDNLLGSKSYFSFQTSKSVYRDQSYLGSFGQYGKFTLQFRYDEIPHIYSNTTRTLFTQTVVTFFQR